MKIKLLLVSLFCSLNMSNYALSYRLDNKVQELRKINNIEKRVTAYEESIERGKYEPWAKPIGMILRWEDRLPHGNGVLIAPNIVLTSAHVILSCLEKPDTCSFSIGMEDLLKNLKVNSGVAAFVPKEYIEERERFIKLTTQLGDLLSKLKEKIPPFITDRLSDDKLFQIYKQNFHLLDSDSQKLFKEIEALTINIEESDRGASYDIGILQLENSYPENLNYPLINGAADPTEPQRMFGASFSFVTDNNSGTKSEFLLKHIAVFDVKKDSKRPKFLFSPVKIATGNIADIKTVDYDYPLEAQNKAFLRGWQKDGDSGSPLIQTYKTGKTKVMGIATGFLDFYKKVRTGDNTYDDAWVSVSAHRAWIKDIVAKIQNTSKK